MKLSFQWLSEFVDLSGVTPAELAKELTGAGLAVDAVVPRNQGITGVVVGHVVECNRHPDADKLHVCKVDVGEAELYQIVCGAANVAAGMKYPVALPGATLPFGVKIKKAKLRGVESNGMLCSAKELGMEVKLLPVHQTTGLYQLPGDLSVGQDIVSLLNLNDVILEVDLTPNRSDCLSMRGFAYEVAAILGQKANFKENPKDSDGTQSSVRVRIETPLCTHYEAQVLQNVASQESPLWMQMRLMAMGVRPIDLIVDVTNYVMLEWGQPLHAFDLNKVQGKTIIVRQAQISERIVTLDGVERTLDEGMTVIADPAKAIGIAGVMGGENSEISSETTAIVIESAAFHPGKTRRTGQKLGLHSEAQQRFEKGIDSIAVRAALLRATELLVELAGADRAGGIVSVRTAPESSLSREVAFSPKRCNAILGTQIEKEDMKRILERLGFTFTVSEPSWRVLVPTRRPDITIEADLVEEIGRLYGLDSISSTLPFGPTTVGVRSPFQKLCKDTRNTLLGLGVTEVVTYAFIRPDVLNPLNLPADSKLRDMVPLMKPMSDDRTSLRTHMLPSLAEVARYNLTHGVNGGRIFEIARTYHPDELPMVRQPQETIQWSGLWFGQTEGELREKSRAFDFYDTKGVIESWLKELGQCDKVSYEPSHAEWFHPGRCAEVKIGETSIGCFGEIHPETGAAFEIGRAIYAEFDLEKVLESISNRFLVQSPQKYPASRRDLAIVIDESVRVGDMLQSAKETAGANSILESCFVFDVYQGIGIQEGKKSVALGFIYQAPDRTLTDDEIETVQDRILQLLKTRFDAELRV